MATQLFLTDAQGDIHRGNNEAALDGSTTDGWRVRALATAAGSGLATAARATVAGATNGIEVFLIGRKLEWVSLPVDADVTISGAITGNLWSSESNMSANVAINFVVDRVGSTGTITQIVKSARTTELPVGTRSAANFTATPGAGVTVNKGERIRVRVFGDDAGTMASGHSFDFGYSGGTGGADGDSFVSFTETFGFLTADPTGTTLYLTDTSSDVATADVDREAWTSRGGSAADDVRNTAAGWTAPIQTTDTAGGTPAAWFSKQIQAFTLTGKAKVNIRASESNTAADASVGAELARVDSDGTNPTVWAYANVITADGDDGEITASEAAYIAYPSGDDLAFTDGQRLRVRLFVDDKSTVPLVTGHTVTTYYNGPTGGASGDTFLILPQTVSEFTGGGALTGSLFSRGPTFFTGAISPGPVDLAGSLFTKASTFLAGTLTSVYALTGVLFTKAGTFFAGAVTATHDLAGAVFSKAPTFPAGTVTPGAVDLAGTLFQKAPTFFVGSVGQLVDGALFTKAPTFFAGTVSPGPVDLAGTVFTKAPTFPQGAVTSTYDLAGTTFTKAPSFFTGAIASTYDLAGTVFAQAPTFPAGTITTTADVAGVLFTKAPSFFGGTVATAGGGDQAVDGVLFQRAATFNIGTVASTYDLAGVLFQKAPTFPAGTVTPGSVDVAGVVFTRAPTFPQGAVAATYDLAGALFSKAPSFFAGSTAATYDLAGTLFTKAPTFFTGTITSAGALLGALFSKSPTFFVGTVTPGAVTVSGVLFQRTPTFPQGTLEASNTVSGVLFTRSGTFFSGAIAATFQIDGVVFTRAGTFFTGTITAGAVDLAGVLFTKTGTFHIGQILSGNLGSPVKGPGASALTTRSDSTAMTTGTQARSRTTGTGAEAL